MAVTAVRLWYFHFCEPSAFNFKSFTFPLKRQLSWVTTTGLGRHYYFIQNTLVLFVTTHSASTIFTSRQNKSSATVTSLSHESRWTAPNIFTVVVLAQRRWTLRSPAPKSKPRRRKLSHLLPKHLHIKGTITLGRIYISRNYVSKKDVFRAELIKQDSKRAKAKQLLHQSLPQDWKPREKRKASTKVFQKSMRSGRTEVYSLRL